MRPPLLSNHRFEAAVLLAAVVLMGLSHASAEPAPGLRFGTDGDARDILREHGIRTHYTQVWAGAWLQRDGWNHFDELLRRARDNETTPLVQFYYWGNDLTPECFADGCDAPGGIHKNQAWWNYLTGELGRHLQNELQGRPAVVVLETEFNKAMRDSEELDAALAAKAAELRALYPPATIVLGFGNWGRDSWPVFDHAAQASDEVGLQLMRGSVRDTPDMIRNAPDDLLDGAREAQRLFGKPLFVTDVALSSHGGAEYEAAQADAIGRLFELSPQLRELGVHALIYRSILDNPRADTSDYYGEAEKSFGLVWTENRTHKPAFAALVNGLRSQAEAEPPVATVESAPAAPASEEAVPASIPFFPMPLPIADEASPAEDAVALLEDWFAQLLRP